MKKILFTIPFLLIITACLVDDVADDVENALSSSQVVSSSSVAEVDYASDYTEIMACIAAQEPEVDEVFMELIGAECYARQVHSMASPDSSKAFAEDCLMPVVSDLLKEATNNWEDVAEGVTEEVCIAALNTALDARVDLTFTDIGKNCTMVDMCPTIEPFDYCLQFMTSQVGLLAPLSAGCGPAITSILQVLM